MKTSNYIRLAISCLLMTAIPLIANAQTNVQKAFDKFIENPEVTITETHSLQKDPTSGLKTSQLDVYNFTIPKGKKALVDNLMTAFRKDLEMTYSTGSGTRTIGENGFTLMVGEDPKSGICINPQIGCKYIYSCFLAPKEEDPEGIHRYAYAMNWIENNGNITGSLYKTYATTLKYRQDQAALTSQNPVNALKKIETWTSNGGDNNSWFRTLMKYVSALDFCNDGARATIAGYIYEVTRDLKSYPEVNAQDKKTAKEIITTLMNNKKNSDPIVRNILHSALQNLL